MAKPILGYWNIRGICQPIRLLFAYLGIDYEDKQFTCSVDSMAEWYDVKFQMGLQFPNIPFLLDGDVKLTESRAILKYLAREKSPNESLIPADFETARMADLLENICGELIYSLIVIYCWRMENEGEKKRLRDQYKDRLKELSGFLGDKIWILGEKLTYVDFLGYEALYMHSKFDKDCISPYKNLCEYMKRFEKIPRIAEYMASPAYLKIPCNTPVANHQIGVTLLS